MRPLIPLLALAGGAVALGAITLAAPGTIRLPNDWLIAAPGGPVGLTGTQPQGITVSRDGSRAFVVEAGYNKPALRIIDTTTLATIKTVSLPDAFGVALRDVDDDGVWVAGASDDEILHVDTTAGTVDRTIEMGTDFDPTSIARSPDGKTLAVTGDLSNRVAFVDEATGVRRASYLTGGHPKATAFDADGSHAFVADWGGRAVDVFDLAKGRHAETIEVGLHPSAFASDGRHLYVADADDDDLSVIDLATRKAIARVDLGFGPLVGASPNNLTLDGDRLYVSCGAANVIAVLHVDAAGAKLLGTIPTGWYPSAIATAHGTLLIADAKGEGGHANPAYQPLARVHQGDGRPGYIAGNLVGSIRSMPIPDDAALAATTAASARLGEPYAHTALPSNPIVRAHGPIRHVIYIIKENRTYDQILGDLRQAEGDPQLVMFGRANTPNEHALATRFGIFDRFFDNAHVSADGHNWSLAAFANDYLEKMWPAEYAGRRSVYDFEDGAIAAVPHSGYLWDLAARSHVSFRNYGEFETEGPLPGSDVTTAFADLRDRTDLHYPTFDMSIRDVDRITEWKREYLRFLRTNTLPQIQVVRLPRDHTAGTRPGSVTPQGMVADNDRAVGELADIVSHGSAWKSTAIFVLEDDAQNGADHVDEQRSTFYLISPYARGGVQHQTYTTAGVLHTIELLFGMPPLTPYDAGARPMYAAFTTHPNFAPFNVLPETVDTEALNTKTAYRASDSAKMDFSREDANPDDELNDIIWHAVKGRNAPLPAIHVSNAL